MYRSAQKTLDTSLGDTLDQKMYKNTDAEFTDQNLNCNISGLTNANILKFDR